MQPKPNPNDLGCTREDGDRAEITLLCEVRQGVEPWRLARLDDISQSGFRIAWLPGCRKEAPLRIRIPGMQVLTAHIRWKKQNAIGCEFSEPLYHAVFEHIVKQCRFDGPLSG